MDNSGKLSGAQIDREWFLYQEKEVFAEYRQKRLTIGLPNETERRENRVCLTPEAVSVMVDMGHTIMVQRGAGEAAHYHDREYADAGAQMVDTCEEVYTADIILKPTPVTQGDVEMMHDRQVILSPIELFELRKEAVVEMMQKKVTAVGFDILKDENGGYPVVQKKMRQWSLRVSAYAQRLLDGLENLDWSDSLKDIQRNWIGRS